MRVVWVTANLPDPTMTGGSVVEYEFIRALADRHEIHLITDHPPQNGDSALSRLGVTHESVEYVRQEHPDSRLGMAGAMLRAQPTLFFWLLRDRLRALSQALAGVEATRPVDLVHATHGELAPVLATARAPTSLLLFDSRVRDKERELKLETLPRRRLQNRAERWRSARWERRWYSGVDGLAAVSPLDAAVTSRLLKRVVDVMPLPIGPEFFVPAASARVPGSVTFVGTLAYPPNLDAVHWLVNEIWPQVRERVPDAQLRIVGRADGDTTIPVLADEVRRAGGTLATDVPEILPWYWESNVVVAPLRLGSGLRTKTIHAMAAGAPVVATPAALEGIDATPGRDVLVGTTAEEIADRVAELLLDPERARSVADAARRVAKEFRAEVVNERFDAWWRAASGSRER